MCETGAQRPGKATGTALWVTTRQLTQRLKTNIKAFCIACLLSTASPSYKFGVTGIVMDTLKKSTIGLPEGWYNNTVKQGAVSSAVMKYMTWMQADMKKLLADAIISLGGPNTCTTPLHWAHFAVIMCSGYIFKRFWDNVDEKLKAIHDTASSQFPNDTLKVKKDIHMAYNNILHIDFEMWGDPICSGQYATHDGVSSSNPIQQAIDNVATTQARDLGDLSVHCKVNGQAHHKKH
ncbi:hypothetical protein EI94DRAFT_1705255 [Lactarius quietus]|nr:hypothetical protein EI94DRAFT_1705255 [Lactarius quietus]